jgi:hypothetical protein
MLEREPLVLNNRSYSWITNRICGIVENKQPALWWMLFIPSVLAHRCDGVLLHLPHLHRRRCLGQKQPVAWAWDITNFVFWIGIGHAGTLISAILFLTRQKWRTSVNRAAEAMTIFAVMCAGIFPGLPRRPCVDGVVPRSDPERQRHLAELQIAVAVGRVRGFDLLHVSVRISGTSAWCRTSPPA